MLLIRMAVSDKQPKVTAPQPVRSSGINYALKAKYAAYPETYKMMQKFLGSLVTIASEGGCPTPAGFFIHSGLFFVVLWSIMLFPRDL